MAQRGREIDNVREALDWAFADGGDTMIGVALTAVCAPVWLYLSLLVISCRFPSERRLPLRVADRPEFGRMEDQPRPTASSMRLADRMSGVPKPSVNRPYTDASFRT
jgi:hypothetical protein